MKYLLLVAMLLLPTLSLAGPTACEEQKPFAKPGDTLVNVRDTCHAMSPAEYELYMQRLTGSKDPCDKARKELDTKDVLVVLPSGSCVSMSRPELERKLARIQRP